MNKYGFKSRSIKVSKTPSHIIQDLLLTILIVNRTCSSFIHRNIIQIVYKNNTLMFNM
jgi:hypothetical protein